MIITRVMFVIVKKAKIALIEDEDTKYDTYYAYANLRMTLVALAAALSLAAYMILGAYKPMIWLAAALISLMNFIQYLDDRGNLVRAGLFLLMALFYFRMNQKSKRDKR